MNLKEVRDFFWPVLEKLTDEEIRKDQKNLDTDISNIKNANWNENCELAFDEAKKLNELENQRRGSADSKAAIYLTAITALTPVLVSLIPGVISNDKNCIIVVISSFIIFVYALINLLRAALWAFDTLKVSASNRVDINDLVNLWGLGSDKHKEKLTIENLCSVRKNRDGVNRKVTCIKMTHELLLRTFFAFVLLLFVQTLSSLIYTASIDNQASSTTMDNIDNCCRLPINIYRL
ncbi:hypothetical protein [Yersinia enterocolitica]|uniref:hypothetical protein n=1 Tax=Yersinia enterocolitica TaxID=630 RepID=UPI003F4744F0